MTKKALFLLVLVLGLSANVRPQESERWIPPFLVREYNSNNIPSAGYTGFDAYGPYILYNPTILKGAPFYLLDYTRAHEHGHIYCITTYGDSSEYCADRWAGAQLARTNPKMLELIIEFYEIQVRDRRFSPNHPSGYELAAILREAREFGE